MKDLIVRFSDEHSNDDRKVLSKLLDQEIEDFSVFMSTLGDWKSVGPLNEMEKMLLKTYLVHKLTGKIDGGK